MNEKFLKKDEIEKLNKISFQEIKNLDDIDLVSRFILCLFEEKDEILLDMVYDNSEYDYQEFYEKFKNTSLKPFLHLLFEYQNLYFSLKEAKEQLAETFHKNYRDANIDQLKFTNLLLFIHEKLDLSYGINISFMNSSRKKIEVRDSEYLKYIYNATIQYYIEKEFNYSDLSFEEAYEMLRSPNYKDDLIIAYETNGYKRADIDIDNIPNSVIEHFAQTIARKRDVNYDFLIAKKREIENTLQVFKKDANPGRKFINQEVARIVLNVSYLIRFERFILQDEYDNIFDMKFKNEDLELLYEYVLFWGLKSKDDIGSGFTNVDNWIKSYKKLNENSKSNINVNRINQLRIAIRGK
jgi:hypothetical protein